MQTRHTTFPVRPLVAGLALALVAGLSPVLLGAQDTQDVTVMKRNGDRVSGAFEDMANGQVYIRVSRDDQRKIPVGDVAAIDVTGNAMNLPETETSVAKGGEHVIVFRDGTSAKGEVIDIRGGKGSSTPDEQRLVYMRTNGEEKRFPMDEITRIYFGNFPSNTDTAAGASDSAVTANEDLPAGTVRVPANSDWVPTSINVKKGDRVTFDASGRIQLSNDADDVAQPAGSLNQRFVPASPLPRNYAGALIGRVGIAKPFPIGDTATPIVMPADGPLYLRVNDYTLADNKGAFAVKVMPAGRR